MDIEDLEIGCRYLMKREHGDPYSCAIQEIATDHIRICCDGGIPFWEPKIKFRRRNQSQEIAILEKLGPYLGVHGTEPPVGLSAVSPRGGEDAASIPHAGKDKERNDEPSGNAANSDAVVNRPESESVELKGYRVEARTFASGVIKEVLGTQYGHDWKEVPMQPAANGIPGDMWSTRLSLAHFHSYAQAIALAWAFKATASSLGVYFLQVRIVRYNVRLSWRSEPDGFASRLPNDDRTDKSFTPVEIVEP